MILRPMKAPQVKTYSTEPSSVGFFSDDLDHHPFRRNSGDDKALSDWNSRELGRKEHGINLYRPTIPEFHVLCSYQL